jgi:hypothetical protein
LKFSLRKRAKLKLETVVSSAMLVRDFGGELSSLTQIYSVTL